SRADRARLGIPCQEAFLERAEARQEVAGGDAEGHQIARWCEAIPEVVESDRVAARVERRHERGRRRPHARQHALELGAEQLDAAVRETSAEQRNELAIARGRVAKGESDGVELDPRAV